MKHPVGWGPAPTVDLGRAQGRPRPSWVTKDRQALEFQAGGHCGQTPGGWAARPVFREPCAGTALLCRFAASVPETCWGDAAH